MGADDIGHFRRSPVRQLLIDDPQVARSIEIDPGFTRASEHYAPDADVGSSGYRIAREV